MLSERPVAQSFDMKNLGETGLNQHAWSPMIWAKKEAIMKPLLLDRIFCRFSDRHKTRSLLCVSCLGTSDICSMYRSATSSWRLTLDSVRFGTSTGNEAS